MFDVSKVSILKVVFYFALYLGSHYGIGVMRKREQEKLDQNPNDEKLQNNVKTYNFLFNWYAAAYLIFVLIMLK